LERAESENLFTGGRGEFQLQECFGLRHVADAGVVEKGLAAMSVRGHTSSSHGTERLYNRGLAGSIDPEYQGQRFDELDFFLVVGAEGANPLNRKFFY